MSLVLHIADKVFRIPKGFRSQEDVRVKLTKASVGYEHPAAKSDHCGICSHYEASTCEIVEGFIRPEDWCKKFTRSSTHDDFVETEHPRNKSGEFAKKGGEGQGGGKKKPNFAPLQKPPVVLNAIAQTFKKHGLTKLKAKSETGHPQFNHPDLGTFQVGHSKEGQTYASKFHHNETGKEGVGQQFLHNYLTELKADKENAKSKPEPVKEPESPTTQKSEFTGNVGAPPDHPNSIAWTNTLKESGFIQGGFNTPTAIQYIGPKGGAAVYVDKKSKGGDFNWVYYPPFGQGGIKKGSSALSFKKLMEIHPPTQAPSHPAEKPTEQITFPKHFSITSVAGKSETVNATGVGLGEKAVRWQYTDPVNGSMSSVIFGTGEHAGKWRIWQSGKGEIAKGEGQESFNAEFEKLHPRGEGGKFVAKPEETAPQQIHEIHQSTKWSPFLKENGFTQEKELTNVIKYVGPNGQVLFVHKTYPAGAIGYQWIYHKEPGAATQQGVGFSTFQEKVGISTISEPPAAKKSVSPDILNLSDLKQVGPQLGSNPGGTYEDAQGNKYYVKHPKSKDHARNELLAAALYGAVGGNTLNYHQVVNGDELSVATKLQTLKATALDQLTPEQKKEAKNDFAVQVWLANWDAVGAAGDNVGLDENGKPVSLDFGGALLYRAKGAPKGPYFDSNANEWESMRNPAKNPQTASLYGDMTADELKQSAARLQKINNDQIYQLASQFAPEDQAASLTDKLIARKTAILQKAASVGPIPTPQPPTPQTQPVEQPKPKVPVEDLKLQLDSTFNTYLNEGYNSKVSEGYTKAYHALQTHAPQLSSDEQYALNTYKGAGYQSMNQSARQGSHSNDPKVKQLTNYLNRCEIPMDLQVVRRVKGEFANHIQSIVDVGTRWKERGFTSASLDPQVLQDWGPVTMIIDVPKGTKGATVKNAGESEILFQRDITYLECYHIDHNTKTYFCRMSQQGTI